MTQQNHKPAGARGVAYLRVSSDKQDHQSQRAVIQEWLDRNGLSVSHWFHDTGSRDLANRRPDFQRLLRAVENGLVDWIAVDAKDRFGTANTWEFGKFICQLRDHDCQLWSVSQGDLTADDAVTEILATVDSVRSRDEQVNKSQRSLRGAVRAVRQGEWQGGYPPYGFDVVCLDKSGKEKWRVYYTGAYQRLRLWPDGRPPERYDGKGNFPPKDREDTLRLTPSHDKRRVEMVKKIFHWFATEAVSLRALCTRLNDLRVSPVIGQGWYTSRLGPMLRNPAYLVGQTVWNKNGHGRFLEWDNGQYREVRRVKGRVKKGRKREPGQFVWPEVEQEGLIDRGTWDAVQAKLREIRRQGRAPKNRDLWLAGLIYCGHCGRRMVGWHQKNDKSCPQSYTCPTYRQFGARNEAGCRLHRVNHKVIEVLARRYLDETGEGLEALLGATVGGAGERIILSLLNRQENTQWEYMRLLNRLWREVEATGARSPAGQPWTAPSLCAAYQSLADQHRAETARRLAEKETELEQALAAFARLTNPVASKAAHRQTERLGREIEELRRSLEPLDERVQGLREEMKRQEYAVSAARETLAGDSNRQKAQAVGRVIARVVCRFRHHQAGSQARSTLTEVTVEPLVGAPQTFAMDGVGVPG
jgi:DNA invertase Pin-like site-specific DNA recombinase